jgi:16S rRNA (uracil1498-N3)-methyltransferase
MIRLHVAAPLAAGETIEASAGQAHYLGSVMRRSVGDVLRVFNGRDGEWHGRIAALGRGKASIAVEILVRPQADDADIWLMFAVLKRDQTDLVVQKATELGVSALLPVFTERTNAARVNEDRLHAIAIEAAEQSERLTVPVLHPARPLHEALAAWPATRLLYVAMERTEAAPLAAPLAVPLGAPGAAVKPPAGLLVGPEGGFGPRDHALLKQYDFIRPVSLGPRILRAETAAIAGVVLLQAPMCG